jgi:hypothetical protein
MAPYNQQGATGPFLTNWSPYYFTQDVRVVTGPIGPGEGVCPQARYNVYLANCNMQPIGGLVPEVAIKILPLNQECDYFDIYNADFKFANTFPVQAACNSVVCIIDEPTSSYNRPVKVSISFFTPYPKLTVEIPIGDQFTPIVTTHIWTATREYFNSPNVIKVTGITWVDKNGATGTITDGRLLLVGFNDTN